MSFSAPGCVMSAGSSVQNVPQQGPNPNLPTQVKTPVAGFPLVNGTPTLLTTTAPNDGQKHLLTCSGIVMTGGTAETGGALTLNWVLGGVAQLTQIDAGNHPINSNVPLGSLGTIPIDPGSVVTLVQAALTAGVATVHAALTIQ